MEDIFNSIEFNDIDLEEAKCSNLSNIYNTNTTNVVLLLENNDSNIDLTKIGDVNDL